MKYLRVVCISAFVISIATVVFIEFVNDSTTVRPSTDRQANTASDVSTVTPSNQQNDSYKQNRAQAMSAVRNAYFAAGCKVFTSDEEVLPLVFHELNALKEEAEAHGITDIKFQEELKAVEQDGVKQAQRPGECDYWHQHPDAAYAVRKAIREAAEP